MDPSSVALNVFNTGGAEFEIRYTGRPAVAVFPFPAANVSKLRFDGGATVASHVCINPEERAQTAAIGQRVRVTYRSGAKGNNSKRAEGRLIRSDDDETVVATDEGVLTLRGKLVETVLVLNPDESGVPQLRLTYDDENDDLPLVIRGMDSTIHYTVQHSVLLEPSATVAGRTPATLNIAAQVTHTYPWTITADKITLTEFERLPVQLQRYYEQSKAPSAAMRTKNGPMPSAKSDKPVARSSNSGSIVIERTVRLARAAVGPTVVHVARITLNDARSHYLCKLDPTVANESNRYPLEFVVRLKPDVGVFVPSGPAAVLIDMDPAGGRDHVAPADLRLGFYHDTWDSTNRKRAYHRLGPTTQLTARVEETDTKETTNDATGRTTIEHRLVMTNATPYPAQVKLWLTSHNILYDIQATNPQRLSIQNLTDSYVRETEDEVAIANTHTLQLMVPVLKQDQEASCLLRVVFNRY